MQHDLHKGMRKSDFGTIHGAIAHTLDQGEVVGIIGVKNNFIQRSLGHLCSASVMARGNWDFTVIASILEEVQ